MTTIAERFNPRNNSLNALRLLAAFIVLYSHGYPLTGSTYEPFAVRLGGYDTGGGWAVSAFFTISGFLIIRSAERQTIEAYCLARFLRIFPGLAVLVLVQTFVIGPLVTELPLDAYLPSAWPSLKTILVFPVAPALPEIFVTNPLRAMNGSLWTIPIEATFYILCITLVVFGLCGKTGSIVVSALFLSAYVALTQAGFNWANNGGELSMSVPLYSGIKNGCFFFLGAVMWVWREKVPLGWPPALLAVLVLWLCKDGHAKPLAFAAAGSYLVIWLGMSPYFDLHRVMGKADLSYGVYLYAFPVQQIIIFTFGPEIGPRVLTAAAIPAVLVMAAISWHFVERPSLRLKSQQADRHWLEATRTARTHGSTGD